MADLWRALSAPEIERDVQRLARRTPRLARLTRWCEWGAAFLIAAAFIAAILWRPGPESALTGGILVFLLGWSAWKRHRAAELARDIESEADRISFIQSALLAKEAELDSSAVVLALSVPTSIISMLLVFSLRAHAEHVDLADLFLAAVASPRGLIILACLSAVVTTLARAHLRLGRELSQLRALSADYADETAAGRGESG